jgi:hypothetical protein
MRAPVTSSRAEPQRPADTYSSHRSSRIAEPQRLVTLCDEPQQIDDPIVQADDPSTGIEPEALSPTLELEQAEPSASTVEPEQAEASQLEVQTVGALASTESEEQLESEANVEPIHPLLDELGRQLKLEERVLRQIHRAVLEIWAGKLPPIDNKVFGAGRLRGAVKKYIDERNQRRSPNDREALVSESSCGNYLKRLHALLRRASLSTSEC